MVETVGKRAVVGCFVGTLLLLGLWRRHAPEVEVPAPALPASAWELPSAMPAEHSCVGAPVATAPDRCIALGGALHTKRASPGAFRAIPGVTAKQAAALAEARQRVGWDGTGVGLARHAGLRDEKVAQVSRFLRP